MKNALILLAVLGVAFGLAWLVVVSKGEPPGVGASDPVVSAAPAETSAPKPKEPAWVPVGDLSDLEAHWSDPCGGERKNRDWPCGAEATIISRVTAEARQDEYKSLYPWRMTLRHPKVHKPIQCGFHMLLNAPPDPDAPPEASWRTAHCVGGDLPSGSGAIAQRLSLMFPRRGDDKSTLRLQLGDLPSVTMVRELTLGVE